MSTAAAAADAADSAKPKNNLKKIILLAVAGLLVVGAVGGGVVYYLKKKQAAAAEESAEGGDEAVASGPKRDPKAVPVFVPMEPFTVNLSDKNADRFAQVTISLEVQTSKVGDQVRAYMPAVRSAMLLILASKSADELIVPEGKVRLAHELHLAALRTIGAPTRGVEPPAGLPPAPAPAAPAPKSEGAAATVANVAAGASAAAESAPVKVAVAAVPKPPRGEVDPPVIVAVHFSNFIIQ